MNKKVMIFGTFDYFHAGHEDLIRQASELGQTVIVVVARDKTVKRVKGQTPDHNEKERLKVLREHPLVTKAILGNDGDKHKVILDVKPDIIALGYDQFVFTHTLKKLIIENKLVTEIVRLLPYKPEMFKSSKIKMQLESTK